MKILIELQHDTTDLPPPPPQYGTLEIRREVIEGWLALIAQTAGQSFTEHPDFGHLAFYPTKAPYLEFLADTASESSEEFLVDFFSQATLGGTDFKYLTHSESYLETNRPVEEIEMYVQPNGLFLRLEYQGQPYQTPKFTPTFLREILRVSENPPPPTARFLRQGQP